MKQEKEIFDYLRSISCCRVCSFRWLKGGKDELNDIDAACNKRGFVESTNDELGTPKKIRENTCIACLGAFENHVLDAIVEEVKTSTVFQQYDCTGFLISISLPIVLHLRQLSLWLDLVSRFPEVFDSSIPPDIAIKDALKIMLIGRLQTALDKPFTVDGVSINIPFVYEKERDELANLAKVKPMVFADRSFRKHCRKEFITRNAFEKHFTAESVNGDTFRQYYTVPPAVQDERLQREALSFTGPTIFMAGRYNKISRELCQSPWITDGQRMMASSVQELMTAVVGPCFKVPEGRIIFSSSGREDVDVRCLGDGRPFVLEIPDAYRDQLPDTLATELEQAIEQSKQIAVRDLQLVKREDLVHIRGGEEDKRKFYRALCVVEGPVTGEMVRKLTIEQPFVIEQVTPLRVLHRRTLLTRPRTVYSVKAFACASNPRALIVDIVTQAGTYIKELVHSDFGRTKPSFKSMIGEPIDIHALDVMAIDLDWPQRLRR